MSGFLLIRCYYSSTSVNDSPPFSRVIISRNPLFYIKMNIGINSYNCYITSYLCLFRTLHSRRASRFCIRKIGCFMTPEQGSDCKKKTQDENGNMKEWIYCLNKTDIIIELEALGLAFISLNRNKQDHIVILFQMSFTHTR